MDGLVVEGLSPPTRGSRPVGGPGRAAVGSIPAHAGKPARSGTGDSGPGVYPRPRGEALEHRVARSIRPGLSPPTRGSRNPCRLRGGLRRSIPAHAGKPTWCWPSSTMRGVYPRPRGEARRGGGAGGRRRGLSPPTRGSHALRDGTVRAGGSIPAHAGKPRQDRTVHPHRAVYPRPRGEAGGRRTFSEPGAGLSPPTRGSRHGDFSCPPHSWVLSPPTRGSQPEGEG